MKMFVGQEFYGSVKFIVWVAMGYAFNGMYYMVSCYIFYEEKTYIILWLTLTSAVLNAIFNYIFIKMYGAIGAAMATTLSFFVLFITTWIVANRLYKMPWLLRGKENDLLDEKFD